MKTKLNLSDIEKLGHLQSRVLEAVWELGEATVHQLVATFAKTYKPTAYTTILSTLQKLDRAGWVKHKMAGRQYVYSATKAKGQVYNASIMRIVGRSFGGDPVKLVCHVLETETLTPEQIANVRRLLQKRSRS